MSAPGKRVKELVASHAADTTDEGLLAVYLLGRNGHGGSSARGLRAVFELGVATHNTEIQAVLGLHEKVPTGLGYSVCAVCKDPDWNDANSVWPCPTVALLVPTSKETK